MAHFMIKYNHIMQYLPKRHNSVHSAQGIAKLLMMCCIAKRYVKHCWFLKMLRTCKIYLLMVPLKVAYHYNFGRNWYNLRCLYFTKTEYCLVCLPRKVLLLWIIFFASELCIHWLVAKLKYSRISLTVTELCAFYYGRSKLYITGWVFYIKSNM